MKHVTRKILILGLGTALIGGFVLTLPAQAHSPKVHSPLMGASADLYNSFYPEDSLTHQEIEWLIQGAAEEDSPLLRPLHHFYDPINNKGLPGYISSKQWARDGAAQSGIGGDYSWEEALAAYKRGDKQKAYKALGHVVHLVQDASVPAHVRNDPHPHGDALFGGADPFEQAVKDMDKFKIPSIAGLSPTIYSDLDAYFDNTAMYTNTHFYSKDSVGFYDKPVPVRRDSNYIYGKDTSGEYRLVKIKGATLTDKDLQDRYELDFKDPLVLQDYWNRLAPFSIEQSAGVIKLFKDSAEEEIILKEEKLSFWNKTNNFINSFSKSADSVLGWLFNFADFSVSSYQEDSNCGEFGHLMASDILCTEKYISITTTSENNEALQYFYSQLQNIAPTEESNSPEELDTTNETDTTDEANNSNATDMSDSSNSSNDTNNEEVATVTEEETEQEGEACPSEASCEGEVLGDSSANDTGFGNYGPMGPNQTFVRQENILPGENEGAGAPAIVWSEDITYTGMSQMLTDADSNLYYSSGTYILKKFSPDGTLLWENSKEERIHLFITLSPDYRHVYAIECRRNESLSHVTDCYFTAFSASDGSELIERVSVGRRGNIINPLPDPAGNNVYVIGRQKVYAFNIFAEDIVVWEKFNYELGGDSITQFGPPVVYGDKLYAVQRDGRTGGSSELAIIDKSTGEVLNYLRLDAGAIWNTSNKIVLAGDKLLVAYTGPWCGASRRSGYAVYNTSALDDMQDSATPAQTPSAGCSGKTLNLESNGKDAYIVPTKYGAFSIRALTHLSENNEDLIDGTIIFTLDSTSTPTGKISISPDGTVYLFTEEETGSIIYALTTNSEDNPAFQYDSEDEIQNLAAGEGIVYYLTQTHLHALEI